MIDAQAALAAANTALQTVADAFAEQGAVLSKLSLERDALSEANIALQAQLDTANATIAVLTDPWRSVDKTGAADVTEAFQAAMDKTGRVPAGTYLIDAVKGITVKAGRKVVMDPDAELFVITNGAPKYALLTIEADAEVSGGNITGDRLDHNYSSGGTHEWGYGVKVVGDRAKVSDIWIGYCTGDGIIVSADDVTLTRVISQRNRRQGMSVFDAKRLKLVSCKFVDTGDMEGNPGTAPKAGVDIEPDSGAAEDIEFHDCIFANNGTANLLLWTRGGTTASITNVKVIGGSMSGAPNGIQVRGNNGTKITLAVDGCAIKRGSGSGIRAETGAVVKVTNNTFSTPTTRTAFELTGTDTRTKYDIYTPSTSPGTVDVGTNRYV